MCSNSHKCATPFFCHNQATPLSDRCYFFHKYATPSPIKVSIFTMNVQSLVFFFKIMQRLKKINWSMMIIHLMRHRVNSSDQTCARYLRLLHSLAICEVLHVLYFFHKCATPQTWTFVWHRRCLIMEKKKNESVAHLWELLNSCTPLMGAIYSCTPGFPLCQGAQIS